MPEKMPAPTPQKKDAVELQKEREGIITNEITPKLENINFEAFDSDVVKKIANAMVKVMEEFTMTKQERADLISHVRNVILQSNTYMEQFPPAEVAQAIVSLITTGRPWHFTNVVLEKDVDKTVQSLASYAVMIKNKTKLAQLKEEAEKGKGE